MTSVARSAVRFCLPAALACGLIALSLAAPARASTPEAWAELFDKAGRACIAASGLADAQVQGKPVGFSDRVLILVRGRWPQPHMKGEPPATFACLYDMKSGTAEAQDLPAF